MIVRLLSAFLLAALAGCASVDSAGVDPYAVDPIAQHLQRDDAVGYCARLFADIDRRVDTLDRRDAEARRIDGFPYLRVSRLDAALAQEEQNPRRYAAWLARLAAADDAARSAELANAELPEDDLARCRALLLAEDRAQANELLRSRARVPDDYSTVQRALGLYPLTRLAFAAGIARWHDGVRAVFAQPLDALPVRGRLQRYALSGGEGDRPVSLPVGLDALGLPLLSRFDRTALLQQHAPVLEIDVAGSYDRPGSLRLDGDDRPLVDPAPPIAYTRVTHTLFGGRPHLQLVYTFWFSERPADGAVDLLAGRIDGLIWRVTLADDGTPLVYDSIHPCGCYHLFFPTPGVSARAAPASLDEGLFVPQAVRAPAAGERVVIRLESATHYVQRVMVEAAVGGAAVRYALADERLLASLPRPDGGTRSAYGSDALMAGTERAERFFFWPSGVESAGQMRQWGHHATAFVGRRHFDDPHLMESYFQLRKPAARVAAP